MLRSQMLSMGLLGPDHKSSDKESHCATNKHVRWEVLPRRNSRCADHGRVTIRKDRNPLVFSIFGSHDRCNRPGLRGMAGWETIAALPKVAPFVAFERPFSLGH